MTSRTTKRGAAALVVLLGVTLALAVLVAACGSSDKWVGTWVDVKDPKTGFVIESPANGAYKIHDPDGSNAFTATLGSDGALHGQLDLTAQGAPGKKADMTVTMKGDHLFVDMAVGGKTIATLEAKKK